MSEDIKNQDVTPEDEATKSDAASTIAASLERIADIQEKQNAKVEELEKKLAEFSTATQTESQALDAEEKAIRDRANEPGADTSKHIKEMEDLLAKRDAAHAAELAEIRRSVDFRASQYSLGEFTEKLEQDAGVVKDATKQFYGNLTKSCNTESFRKKYGDLTPAHIVMNGAMEAKDVTYRVGGKNWTVKNMAPVTVGGDDVVVRNAQEANDNLFAWMLWKQARREHFGSLSESPFYAPYKDSMQILGKAMQSSDISNWVPTGFSSRLIERYELERNLTRFIPFFLMPQNPFDLPVRGAYLTAYKVTGTSTDPESATAITSTAIEDLKCTLNLHQIAFRAVYDIEAEEDSIPSLVPALIEDLALSWAYTLEDMILNSDDAVEPVPGHMDSDITSSSDYRTAWAGLRAEAINQSYTTDINTFTVDNINYVMQAEMGKYAARPSDVFAVTGPKTRAKLKVLKDSSNNPVVMGAAAPGNPPAALSGVSMEELDGKPLVVSEACREDVNATGFYDGTTTNLGTLTWVNKRGWLLASRNQAPRIMTNQEPRTLQTEIVMHTRYEFEDVLPIASNHTVELGVNVAFT